MNRKSCANFTQSVPSYGVANPVLILTLSYIDSVPMYEVRMTRDQNQE